MLQYQQFLNDIMTSGRYKENRTGTAAYAIAGYQMRFDLSAGFPLVTTKKCHLHSIIHELLWFIRGDTSNQSLNDVGVTIWDEWAVPEDDLYVRDLIHPSLLRKKYMELKGWGEEEWNAFTLQCADKYNTTRSDARVMSDIAAAMKADGLETVRYTPRIKKGDLGPIYGKQWRDWVGVSDRYDQLKTMVETLKNNPTSRRIIVSAWNPEDLPDEKLSPQENVKNGKMALAPCHCFFQALPLPLSAQERVRLLPAEIKETIDWKFDKDEYGNNPPSTMEQIEAASSICDGAGIPKYILNLQVYIRSNDAFLGAPFNIASYALLTMMLAQVSNMLPGELIYTVGDAHIYENHQEQVDEQLARQPYALPTMHINPNVKDLFDFKFDDFSLINYVSHPAIKAPIAI